MRKSLLAVLVAGCVAVWHVEAQTAKPGKAVPKEDQEGLRNSIIQKYDLNGDGVLDKGETKGLSKEDKKSLAKTGGVGTVRKSGSKAKDGGGTAQPEAKPETKPETKPDVVRPTTKPAPTPQPAEAQTSTTTDVKRAEKSGRGKPSK